MGPDRGRSRRARPLRHVQQFERDGLHICRAAYDTPTGFHAYAADPREVDARRWASAWTARWTAARRDRAWRRTRAALDRSMVGVFAAFAALIAAEGRHEREGVR